MQTGDYVNFDNVQFQLLSASTLYRQAGAADPRVTHHHTGAQPNRPPRNISERNRAGRLPENFGLAGADLAIRKRATPEPVVAGQTLTYIITVTNNGPTNAAVTRAIDTLPAGFTPVTVTASRGTWTSPNWNIGTMTPGQVDSLVITGTVNVNQCTSLRNYATVTSNTSDPT